VIQAPTEAVQGDLDPATPGVQAHVRLRTTLPEGAGVEVTIATPTNVVLDARTIYVDAAGNASLSGATLPQPQAVIRARALDEGCGAATDAVIVAIAADVDCAITISPEPRASSYYAPLGVLSASDDRGAAPGLQGAIAVRTRPGWTVEVFEAAGGLERSLGPREVGASGTVEIARDFADGTLAIRAACAGAAGGGAAGRAAASAAIVVDTAAPRCAIAAPVPGSSITPADDANADLADGVQLAIAVRADGGDTAGERVELTLTPTGGAAIALPAAPLDATGATRAQATLAPATTPAGYAVALTARDRVGNACTRTAAYEVVYGGCEIDVVAPVGPVTADADGDPGNGSQLDVRLAVGAGCVGRAVTSVCGGNDPGGVVPASGVLALRVDACATSPCERAVPCAFRVSTPGGVATTAAAELVFDDQGPLTTVELVQPALACGAVVTQASDADPSAPGVQVVARVAAPSGPAGPGGSDLSLEVTSTAGTTSAPAAAPVSVTLAPGPNSLIGRSRDELGNLGRSAACAVTLVDLALALTGAPADGLVGRPDGTVSGGALALPVCGTVDRPGAAVRVAVDGGPATPAAVVGTAWCAQLTLAEAAAPYRVQVTAIAGPAFGLSVLPLRVDLTPPPPPAALAAADRDRRSVLLSWIAPDDGGQPPARYVARHAGAPIDDASFDSAGTAVPAPDPQVPGATELMVVDQLRAGPLIYAAVAAVDAAGNRSAPAVVGPLVLGLDQTGARTSPEPSAGTLALGAAIAHGRFNGDDLDDLAVAAPQQDAPGAPQAGAVYVYYGAPGGLPIAPDLIIRGAGAGARLGSALAAVRRAGPGEARDDLAIGAPLADSGRGRVYVFAGGGLPVGSLPATAAEVEISVAAAAPGQLAGGNLGARLAATDFDGDGREDLAIAAPLAGGGAGAVAIVYGGTISGDVALSDVDQTGAAAVAQLLTERAPAAGRRFGFYLHAVGPTRGPGDATGDLVVGTADDLLTTGDSVSVLRGDGVRPAAPGVTARPFAAGRDVQIELVSAYRATDWGAQVAAVDDLDGDGARDLAIGAPRTLGQRGQVLIVRGGALGAAGLARTTDPGLVITALTGAPGARLGSLVAAAGARESPDLDGDGLAELIVAGMAGGLAHLYAWYGGAIPTGPAAVDTAALALVGPAQFQLTPQRPQGAAGVARWIGDLNGDGLADLCWASPFDNTNGGDGGFEVLWDE
jgi:hypothetical protein